MSLKRKRNANGDLLGELESLVTTWESLKETTWESLGDTSWGSETLRSRAIMGTQLLGG